MTSLEQRMEEDGYEGYAYSYPHKTAYRPLVPAVPLEQAWGQEDLSRLFLYLHLPFCEMRCGFCNLFTTVRPSASLVQQTLRALQHQAAEVARRIEPVKVAQAAVGGGTPSYLSSAQLESLFFSIAEVWPIDWSGIPVSLEVSPATATPEKLKVLKRLGVKRLSLGVQSFLSEDLAALHRPELGANLERVCEEIRSTGFPTVNLDLIYGIEGQDEGRWQRNLSAALRWRPEELYLYPLYVGPLTGLDRLGSKPASARRALYFAARERLLQEGYVQVSMRLFRLRGQASQNEYCCQEDGMVGLGPGARSYTRALHYSSEYAVGQPGVRAIIGAYAQADYSHATYGVHLDPSEQRRRYLLKSLLRVEGLNLAAYRRRFASDAASDFQSAIAELGSLNLVELGPESWRLTPRGLAYTDTIGPWLYSEAMRARMRDCQLQ